jgi:cysteine desulfurase/selenocysteine lyase
MNLNEVRSQIPLLSKNVYLDNAGAGPPPNSVHKAMEMFLDEWRDYGEKWDAWLLEIVRARELFGKLIGADVEEIANVPNVTSGLAAIANALDLKPGRNVVVSELNFPTNVYMWHALKQKGHLSDVRVMKARNGQVPLSEYENAINEDTAAVSVDYVSWINGCRENIRDITKIAHSRGALMLVDAFHALGVFPVDVRKLNVDVLTCGTYKWLMGPHGTAFLYVKQKILEDLQPAIVGWHGIADSVVARAARGEDTFGRPFDLSEVKVARDATRFEWGTWAVIAVMGAQAALKFTLKYPPEERAPAIERLTEHLITGLEKLGRRVTSPTETARRSGIVTFEVEDAGRLAKRLQDENVIVAPRVNTLRISPHFYNTEAEIDTLLQKL